MPFTDVDIWQVAPVCDLPGEVSPYCPRVLCNLEPALVLIDGVEILNAVVDGWLMDGWLMDGWMDGWMDG